MSTKAKFMSDILDAMQILVLRSYSPLMMNPLRSDCHRLITTEGKYILDESMVKVDDGGVR